MPKLALLLLVAALLVGCVGGSGTPTPHPTVTASPVASATSAPLPTFKFSAKITIPTSNNVVTQYVEFSSIDFTKPDAAGHPSIEFHGATCYTLLDDARCRTIQDLPEVIGGNAPTKTETGCWQTMLSNNILSLPIAC